MPTITIGKSDYYINDKCVDISFNADDYQITPMSIGEYKLSLSSTSINIPDGYIKIFGNIIILQDDVDMTSGSAATNAQSLYNYLNSVYFLADYEVTINGLEITINTGKYGALDQSLFDVSLITGSSEIFNGSDGEYLDGYTILYSLYKNGKKYGLTHSVRPIIGDSGIIVNDVKLRIQCPIPNLKTLIKYAYGFHATNYVEQHKIKFGAIYSSDCARKGLPFVFSDTYNINCNNGRNGFLTQEISLCYGSRAIFSFKGLNKIRFIFNGSSHYAFNVTDGFMVIDDVFIDAMASGIGVNNIGLKITGIGIDGKTYKLNINRDCCGDTIYYYNQHTGAWNSVNLNVVKETTNTEGYVFCKSCVKEKIINDKPNNDYKKDVSITKSIEYSHSDVDLMKRIFESPRLYRLEDEVIVSVFVQHGSISEGKITITR